MTADMLRPRDQARRAVGVAVRKFASHLPLVTQRRIRAIRGRRGTRLGVADESIFHITAANIARSRAETSGTGHQAVRSATWFISAPRHVAFGGLYTIFRFISDFRDRGVEPQIAIYGDDVFDVIGSEKSSSASSPTRGGPHSRHQLEPRRAGQA